MALAELLWNRSLWPEGGRKRKDLFFKGKKSFRIGPTIFGPSYFEAERGPLDLLSHYDSFDFLAGFCTARGRGGGGQRRVWSWTTAMK
jgi:hypothetical protein